MDTTRWMERALAHFTRWAQRHEDDPDLLLADAPALVAALRWAVAQHRWREVLRLGKRVQDALLLGGRCGLAVAVCSWLVAGSTELGDTAAKAWALHQRGTQRLLTGDEAGTEDLEEASRLRQELGDKAGAQASRANVPSKQGLPVGAKVAAALLALAVAVIVLGVLWVNRAVSQDPTPSPSITTTPAPTTTPSTTATTIPTTTTDPTETTDPTRSTNPPSTSGPVITQTTDPGPTGATPAPGPDEPPGEGPPTTDPPIVD